MSMHPATLRVSVLAGLTLPEQDAVGLSEWCAAVARLCITGGTAGTVKKQRAKIRGIIVSIIEGLPRLEGGINNPVNSLYHDWVSIEEARELTLGDEDTYSIVSWLSWREHCIGAGNEATDKMTVGYAAAEAFYTASPVRVRARAPRAPRETDDTGGRASGRARARSPSAKDKKAALQYKALKLAIPLACAGKLKPAQTARVSSEG